MVIHLHKMKREAKPWVMSTYLVSLKFPCADNVKVGITTALVASFVVA